MRNHMVVKKKPALKSHGKCRDCKCKLKYKYETVVCFHCYLKATKTKKKK